MQWWLLIVWAMALAWLALIVHEGAHMLVARRLRIPVRVRFGWPTIWVSSTIGVGPLPFGEVTPLDQLAPVDEIVGASAGFLANLLMVTICFVVVSVHILTTTQAPYLLWVILIGLMQALYGLLSFCGWDGAVVRRVLRRRRPR